MLICPILSPYFGRPWSCTEYQCHSDHALVVCNQLDEKSCLMAEFDSLVSFLQGANENVDLPYFCGPWTDYHCCSETTDNYIISLEYSGPRPMQLSLFLEFDIQCKVLFFWKWLPFKHLDKARIQWAFVGIEKMGRYYGRDTENLDISMTVSIGSISLLTINTCYNDIWLSHVERNQIDFGKLLDFSHVFP